MRCYFRLGNSVRKQPNSGTLSPIYSLELRPGLQVSPSTAATHLRTPPLLNASKHVWFVLPCRSRGKIVDVTCRDARQG